MSYAITEEGLNAGVAIDLYTESSKIDQAGYFDNEYTPLGESIYQIKYKAKTDAEKNAIINDRLFPQVERLLNEINYFDNEYTIVCPVPPTEEREYQPVFEIAKRIAKYKGKTYFEKLLKKESKVRAKNLADGLEFDDGSFKAFRLKYPTDVVIVDDTYGKGRTLRACIKELRKNPNVKKIFFISVVKNRRGGLVR